MEVIIEDARYIYESKSKIWRELAFLNLGISEYLKGEPITIEAILKTYHSLPNRDRSKPSPIMSYLEEKLWYRVKRLRERGRPVEDVVNEMRADTLLFASAIARTPSTVKNLRNPHLLGFYFLDKIASTQATNNILEAMDSKYRGLTVFRLPHERDVINVAADSSNESLLILEKKLFTNKELKMLKQARLKEIQEDLLLLKTQLSAGSAQYNSSDFDRLKIYVERLARLDPELGRVAREMLFYLQDSPSAVEQAICSDSGDSRFLLELEAITSGDLNL